ncbi:cell division protein FtsX [Pseudoalteromonas sp. NBT06-2]|uniref:permease-like cell division protein FtsX n=1 Tax=Pseudoalteromonas sp. NBT06-2 TaxID=2025950 RepID=UPI000BA7CE9A|nr:permease-like cell division protein FtsX [Pseudoalteromonas sp. NBT06-2]PAJ75854.1 cell division protein FtsX [Pseudoalteromonas sp. NBT06-2]
MSLLFKSRMSQASNTDTSLVMTWYFIVLNIMRQGVHSLGEIWRTTTASMMTVAVLGVSLTLPTTLYLVVKNVQQVSSGFENASEISLFVKQGLPDKETKSLVKRLKLYPEISDVTYISNEVALEEFKQVSGFGQALDYLDSNPLPSVISVTPTKRHSKPETARKLLIKLESEREIDFGKLDIEWLERLNALLSLLRESVITIAFLLLTSVILIIGNTIRLSIMDKKEEIQVMKLVGATNQFIQTPFLWTGIWYGIIGGFFAYICIELMMWWLGSAISEVAGVYQAEFLLQGLSFFEFTNLIVLAVLLGLFGSYLSVKRYIKTIEPDKI